MFDFIYLIAAFGGGIWGAAIGGLFAFILTGVMAIVGQGVLLATGNAEFIGNIAYGPLGSPAITFGGAAAAAAYAYSKGKLATGRDIGAQLISLNDPIVLLVGGVFGALGYALLWAFNQIPAIAGTPWTNTTAFTVMTSAIVARLLFGKSGLFGKVRKGDNRWKTSDVAGWLPWQDAPLQLLVVGLGFGVAASWTIKASANPGAIAGVWFGVSAFALILLQFGAKAPVWHHIVLASEQAIAVGGGDIWWGVTFGVIGSFLGDIAGNVFTAHADTHIDPPAVSLWITFTLTAILKAAGIFTAVTGVGSLVVAVVVSAALYALAAAMKAKPNTGK